MEVTDDRVYWEDPTRPGRIPYRHEALTIEDGATVNYVVERRWQDYVVRDLIDQRDSLPEQRPGFRPVWRFAWFGQRARNERFHLDSSQAKFVSRLLQGLADGTPEVGEEDLLKAAGATSVSELFPDDKIGPNGWADLFGPGDQPNTWRINVPADTQAE